MATFGLFSTVGSVNHASKQKSISCAWEDTLNDILTNERSRSFYTTVVTESGKPELTNEGVKSFVLDKLYSIVTQKISKMDVEYQDILKSAGNYQKYRHFQSIDDTVKGLNDLIKNTDKLDKVNVTQLNEIFDCHSNLIKCTKDFSDAFKFNVGTVKQYYLTVVASLIYATGFIVTSMIDYEQRNGNVNYDIVFKNENILERGLPKNMLSIIHQFNEDVRNKVISKSVSMQKNTKLTRESATAIAIGTAVAVGLVALPALIRYAIYFFMHSKIKLAEYFEAQAAFMELNIRKLEASNIKDKEKIIEKQKKSVEKLLQLAAKISADKYSAEKETQKEIEAEDKQVVKDSDDDAKKQESQFNDSDILL